MKLIHYIILISLFLTASCGVTETGNPCPFGDCPTSNHGELNNETGVYQNDTYRVQVNYGSGWSGEESQTATATEPGSAPVSDSTSGVIFSHVSLETTSVGMSFADKPSSATSLLDYIESLHPTWTFVEYNTANLNGYEYDDPSANSDGADLRYYFFGNNDVVIIIVAHVFPSGETALVELLNAISFY